MRYADYMGIQLSWVRGQGTGDEGTENSEFGIRNSELTGDNNTPHSTLHTSNFIDDADISDYAKDAVERLYKTGVIGGYPDGSFKPKGEATRAEVAAMLMRFLEAME